MFIHADRSLLNHETRIGRRKMAATLSRIFEEHRASTILQSVFSSPFLLDVERRRKEKKNEGARKLNDEIPSRH